MLVPLAFSLSQLCPVHQESGFRDIYVFIISVLILVYNIISFKAYIERMWPISHFPAVIHLACVPSQLTDKEKHTNSFRKKFHLA